MTRWFACAQKKIAAGEYGGQPAHPAQTVLQTPTRSYTLTGDYTTRGPFNFYPCSFQELGREIPALLKVVHDPHDSDLARNEARILSLLYAGKEAARFAPYFPLLIEALDYQQDGCIYAANIFARLDGWYSLAEVRRAYPAGVDPKDMAWMFRRLLVALGFAHFKGVIHGAVLPANIWIQPDQHGLLLSDWTYAVSDVEITGEYISGLDPQYQAWYPPEVLAREQPVFGTDIYLAVRSMVYLLGGDPLSGCLPARLPGALGAFIKGCLLPGKRTRPQDAWSLKDEFDDLLARLWGKRTFHPFHMKYS